MPGLIAPALRSSSPMTITITMEAARDDDGPAHKGADMTTRASANAATAMMIGDMSIGLPG